MAKFRNWADAGTMFEIRNEDGQVISQHCTNKEAQAAARVYRNDREMGWSAYQVFEVNR